MRWRKVQEVITANSLSTRPPKKPLPGCPEPCANEMIELPWQGTVFSFNKRNGGSGNTSAAVTFYGRQRYASVETIISSARGYQLPVDNMWC